MEQFSLWGTIVNALAVVVGSGSVLLVKAIFGKAIAKAVLALIIIIAVIVSTCVFTLISRIIALITFTQRNKLIDDVSKTVNESEQCNKVNDFNSDKFILIRRYVMCVICWAMILLYTIYSIGYVGVYHNTQHIWLYTAIWSIIFHWLVLSPIYICVISILKVKHQDKLCYYLTKLSII